MALSCYYSLAWLCLPSAQHRESGLVKRPVFRIAETNLWLDQLVTRESGEV